MYGSSIEGFHDCARKTTTLRPCDSPATSHNGGMCSIVCVPCVVAIELVHLVILFVFAKFHARRARRTLHMHNALQLQFYANLAQCDLPAGMTITLNSLRLVIEDCRISLCLQ